jgi:hypothetical protein|tara:strand:+ start:392 stop:946 length:555 start_codon:yes stop_codon:yes gene_type:complete
MSNAVPNLDKKTDLNIDSFKEKFFKLENRKGKLEKNLIDFSQYITNYGISLLDEAVLTQGLPSVGKYHIEELFELFKTKEISSKSDPKSHGYSALYRKKFYDFTTFHETYLFFFNKAHLKKTKEYIGITENHTGKFLFFSPARNLDAWLIECLNDHKQTTQEVINVLSSPTNYFPLTFGKNTVF